MPMDLETAFERRAALVKPYFKQDIRYDQRILPPPTVAEFVGTPSAGKTTIIRELDKFLRRQGFRCYMPQEGAEAIRYIPRTTPYYNITTGLYAYQKLIEVSEGHQYDQVLFDRCIFDAYAWMKYWHKKGKLTKGEMLHHQEFFLSGADRDGVASHANRIDLAVIVVCDPAIAIARETKNELTKQMGNTTNPDSIKFLIDCNRETYEELKDRFAQLRLLDTSGMTEREEVQWAADAFLSVIERKILEIPKEKL